MLCGSCCLALQATITETVSSICETRKTLNRGKELEKIVACLHLRDAVDRALADTYIRDLVEKASSSKQRKSFGVEQVHRDGRKL